MSLYFTKGLRLLNSAKTLGLYDTKWNIPLKLEQYSTSSAANTYLGVKFDGSTFLKRLSIPPSQFAPFSTFNVLNKCDSKGSKYSMTGSEGLLKEECEGIKKTKIKTGVCPPMPPCLKFVKPPGRRRNYESSKMNCGRICMPCCPKARYPPVCFFPNEKKPCCKVPNPRPAYSECDKDCVKKRSICDCCHIKPPPCRLLPDVDDSC